MRLNFIRQRAREQGKVVVVFFCAGGAERSYAAEQGFRKLLKRLQLSHKFYVWHYGWQGINPRLVASVVRAADFVVPVGLDSRAAMSNVIETLRVKPVLLKPDFHRSGGLLSVKNFDDVLRPIAKARPELGIRPKH